MSHTFTTDWFSNNVELWNRYLSKFQKKETHVLEIGTFEGKSALWMMENILSHKKSHLTCVDNFSFKSKDGEDAYKRFERNLATHKDKLTLLKGDSRDMLRQIPAKPQFDFIYIDADRHSQNTLEDAVLAFPLLKPDGIMIFDDYTTNKEHDNNCPKMGIDAFLNTYVNDIKVLHSGWQVILQRRRKPLKRKPCYSELFEEPREVPWWFKQK